MKQLSKLQEENGNKHDQQKTSKKIITQKGEFRKGNGEITKTADETNKTQPDTIKSIRSNNNTNYIIVEESEKELITAIKYMKRNTDKIPNEAMLPIYEAIGHTLLEL